MSSIFGQSPLSKRVQTAVYLVSSLGVEHIRFLVRTVTWEGYARLNMAAVGGCQFIEQLEYVVTAASSFRFVM